MTLSEPVRMRPPAFASALGQDSTAMLAAPGGSKPRRSARFRCIDHNHPPCPSTPTAARAAAKRRHRHPTRRTAHISSARGHRRKHGLNARPAQAMAKRRTLTPGVGGLLAVLSHGRAGHGILGGRVHVGHERQHKRLEDFGRRLQVLLCGIESVTFGHIRPGLAIASVSHTRPEHACSHAARHTRAACRPSAMRFCSESRPDGLMWLGGWERAAVNSRSKSAAFTIATARRSSSSQNCANTHYHILPTPRRILSVHSQCA